MKYCDLRNKSACMNTVLVSPGKCNSCSLRQTVSDEITSTFTISVEVLQYGYLLLLKFSWNFSDFRRAFSALKHFGPKISTDS